MLHGTRLPHDYVVNLRLTKGEDAAGRAKAGRRPTRRRRGRSSKKDPEPLTSSSESGSEPNPEAINGTGNGGGGKEGVAHVTAEANLEGVSAMEKEIRELEDDEVRRSNAYIGATNTIGSVHQRRWYLSLNREACGLVKRRRGGQIVWGRHDGTQRQGNDSPGGQLAYPFYVRGSDVERSVVTGRLGAEVLRDEGVVGFVQRKGWRAVVK
jgi:hypothetical protein